MERLDSLAVDKALITKKALLVPEDTAIELIDDYLSIEDEITVTEHRLMVELGHATVPDEDDGDDEEQPNFMLHATYCLAAAMVAADGKIEADEIAVAEGIGAQLFGEVFDSVDFRRFCNNPNEIGDIGEIIALVDEALEEDGKMLILQYLKAISESDEDVDSSETELMSQVADGWHIDLAKLK